MASDKLLIFNNGSGLALRANGLLVGDELSVSQLHLIFESDEGKFDQTIPLQDEIKLPRKLLRKVGDDYAFASKQDLDDLTAEEWAALRERSRRRLAHPFRAIFKDNVELFGVRAGKVAESSVWVTPEVIDGYGALPDAAVVLRIELKIQAKFEVSLAGKPIALEGGWRLTVEVRKASVEAVRALIAMDLPKLPGLSLDWPAVSMPKLSFDGLKLPSFGKLPNFFGFSIPQLDSKLRFEPDPPPENMPRLAVALVDGALSLTTAVGKTAGGKLVLDQSGGPVTICVVSELALTYDVDARQQKLVAKIAPTPLPLTTLKNIQLPRPGEVDLPFKILVEELKVKVVFETIDLDTVSETPVHVPKIAYDLKNIRLSALDDPSLFIVFDLAFEMSIRPGGDVATRVTYLAIVEPYPLELIARVGAAAVEAVGRLIRLISAIPLPKADVPGFDVERLAEFLRLLGRLLASAMAWLARQAGKAAGLLAGAVEAVARLIGEILGALADAAKDAMRAVCIEIRLDPKTYRIVQILITPASSAPLGSSPQVLSALGVDLTFDIAARPTLLIDFTEDSWFGLVLEGAKEAKIATDLWLDKDTGPQQPMGTMDRGSGTASAPGKRLIELSVTPRVASGQDLVLVAVQGGRLRLFRKLVSTGEQRNDVSVTTGNVKLTVPSKLQSSRLDEASIGADPASDFVVNLQAAGLKDRILGLLPKADANAQSGGGFAEAFSQKVEIVGSKTEVLGRKLSISLDVVVHIGEQFKPKTTLTLDASLDDLSVKLGGADRIAVMSDPMQPVRRFRPLGFDLEVGPAGKLAANESYEQFALDLSHGQERLALGSAAKASLSFDRVASSGKGLQFELSKFAVGRSGIDLEARVKPDPVRLGGVDMPFKFTSGSVSISGSRFAGGSLMGSGQLPKKLVGEANASIALTLGRDAESDEVVVEAATALIDKAGDPIRCHNTRFDVTISELGMSFVREQSYHFYFLVTGSARFSPGRSEFTRGLLKNFSSAEIRFDKAPLASDPRVLMRSISFLVKLKPPKVIKLFDTFRFELRSIAFYPSSDKMDGAPAMGFGGQMNFLERGDRAAVKVNFHEMLIGPPADGEVLPRIRFDGLGVAISLSGVKISGTAIAVDGDLPSLFRADVLPKGITAHGFLASGSLDVQGWAPMSATLGFLELRDKKDPSAAPRHAFYFYGQRNKMSEPIDTPVGTIYLREVGFGFGYRYTLGGIAQAQAATEPRELVKVLDEVSKVQGSLDRFEAWEPTYDNADLTLALRGMLALSAAQRSSNDYNTDVEAKLPNPLLFDIVAALRTDLTILINLRAWLCVNYDKWYTDGADAEWKRNPVFRGYLYFSAPKREFLGRFISNRGGFIGNNPALPAPLKKAITSTDFSATLFIRPGLFHFELGWPYELGFELGKRGDAFYLSVRGGMIQRVEDASILQGIAFKAYGEVNLGGRIGSDSFGAAAIAKATFDLEARILSYLSLRNVGDSMFYGYLRLDILVDARIEVWLSFKVFGHRVRLAAGFSMYLAVSVAIEAVISLSGLGGRAHASIGVRAFGRTAAVGIGFSFNDGLLSQARARVAGFMELGLSGPVPDRKNDGQRIETNPRPSVPRQEAAVASDQAIDTDLGTVPAPETETPGPLVGEPVRRTNFWAMLFPTTRTDEEGEWFVMQLVPRDHTPATDDEQIQVSDASTFYASPSVRDSDIAAVPWHELVLDAKHGGAVAGISHVFADGTLSPSVWSQHPMNGVARIGTPESSIEFMYVLADLFMAPLGGSERLTEPGARSVELQLERLSQNAQASATDLSRRGRSRVDLSAMLKRACQIEEGRSAVLASVIDSAAALAARGFGQGAGAEPLLDLDARDLGLTFLVSKAALEALFHLAKAEVDGDIARPPKGDFTVKKSDCPDQAGEVFLFNPPSRMFRAAQPSFLPTHRITDQGIVLDWDLEPAWGRSEGAFHDPEFHLRNYRIQRVITGLGQEYRADFVVKAAAPAKVVPGANGQCAVTLLRPDFQFIDDLRQSEAGGAPVAIPDEIRRALLGIDDKDRLLESANVRIKYLITPVDIAGTSDFGEPYDVAIPPVSRKAPHSPRQGVLQLTYKPDLLSPPALRCLFVPRLMQPTRPTEIERELVLHLRVLNEPIEALGTYGGDALDQAGRFDERAIERLAGSKDVTDFVVHLSSPTADASKTFVFQDEDRDPEPDSAVVLPMASYDGKMYRLDGQVLHGVGATKFLAALDADDVLVEHGRQKRLFVRRLSEMPTDRKRLHESDRHGPWRNVPVNLVMQPIPVAPSKVPAAAGIATELKKRQSPGVNTILETFEQPQDLHFLALRAEKKKDEKDAGLGDVEGDSGRLHVVVPPAEGTLDDLLPRPAGSKSRPLLTIRDPARRSAMQVRWRVRATSLRLRKQEGKPAGDLYRSIGGYDVLVIDPDGVPADADLVSQFGVLAKPVGRVMLMPESFDGLEPSGFGDFSRLEATYPSESLRLMHAPRGKNSSGVRQAGWFSAAESAALFAQPSIRRSLLPDPDDAVLASLFAQGKPESLSISIPAWTSSADPLGRWRLALAGALGSSLGEYAAADLPVGQPVGAKGIRFDRPGDGFSVAEVRRLLQNVRLVPQLDEAGTLKGAYDQETSLLASRLHDARNLASISVRVDARRFRQDSVGVRSAELGPPVVCDELVDLAPSLHPVLQDALAFLPYAPQDSRLEEVKDGRVYRRYSLVLDPDPEVKAKGLADWLDETPPERDPYGWGTLRTLGMAKGLRVYDTASGAYLRGTELLGLVRNALRRALWRYSDANPGARFNGQPFVDVLTKPWGNAKLFGFDGGVEDLSPSDQARLLGSDTLCVVQLSLRPAPDRRGLPAGDPSRRVRYFPIKGDGSAVAEWRVTLKAAGQHAFDLLSTSAGLEANPPVRLKPGVEHAFRVPARLGPGDPIAVVRVTSAHKTPLSPADAKAAVTFKALLQNENGVIDQAGIDKALDWSGEIELPEAYAGTSLPDTAFGQFDPLKSADWAGVLFAPEAGMLSPSEAFGNIYYPLARRFGAFLVPTDASDSASGAREQVAEQVVRMWTRFLEHCAPAIGKPPSDTIYFSLGTVADPGTWRRAPDPEGYVSITIPDASRRGGRRRFVVVPFSRYEPWMAARGAQPSSESPLDKSGYEDQLVDVKLDRYDPIEKPVILAASQRAALEIDDFSRYEIVVAHGTDAVLAQANTSNDALLQPLDIRVGYLREFPHLEWLRGLVEADAAYDPMAEFGSDEPSANYAFPALAEERAQNRLTELRKQVPDAWLGSTLVSAASLPYFFRTHVEVHMSAGVVVSDVTRATFEEGFTELHFPFDARSGYAPRTLAPLPSYRVERDGEESRIFFEIPLLRFVDCMHKREAESWFGPGGEAWAEIRKVAHLPEPAVSYRVLLEAVIPESNGEIAACSSAFDILPMAPAGKDRPSSSYMVQSTGQQFSAGPGGAPILVQPTGDSEVWRLTFGTNAHKQRDFEPISEVVAGDVRDRLFQTLQALPPDTKPRRVDALLAHRIRRSGDAAEEGWAARFEAAMSALELSPEAQAVLRQWEVRPEVDAMQTLNLSLQSLGALAHLEELCGAAPVDEERTMLLLRPLPSDEDVKPFKAGKDALAVDRTLWELVMRLASEQIFGPHRRLALSASRSIDRPLHHLIMRAVERELS